MKTGEGKTLVAVLPAFLNALTGKGVHVVTVNDYLARRDAEWMGVIYNFLGLTVDVIDLHDTNRASVEAFPLIMEWIEQQNAELAAQGEPIYQIVGVEAFYRQRKSR